MWPTIATPCRSRWKTATEAMPSSTAISEPGSIGSQRRNPSTTARLTTPTASVGPLVWPSRVRNVQACWKKSPSPFGTPDSLGTWPTMIVRARPTMKALEHRLGDEGGQEAAPEQAGEQREPAGDQGQRRGQRDVPVGAAGGEDRDRAGGQRRGGGHRSDDEVPGVPSAA